MPIAGRTLGDVLECANAASGVSESGFSAGRLSECGQRVAGELEASANLQLAFLVRLHIADSLHLSSATQEDDAGEILSAGITQKIQVSSIVTKVSRQHHGHHGVIIQSKLRQSRNLSTPQPYFRF